jgi:hypothetical protein
MGSGIPLIGRFLHIYIAKILSCEGKTYGKWNLQGKNYEMIGVDLFQLCGNRSYVLRARISD